jgi:hypothetical protein
VNSSWGTNGDGLPASFYLRVLCFFDRSVSKGLRFEINKTERCVQDLENTCWRVTVDSLLSVAYRQFSWLSQFKPEGGGDIFVMQLL